MAVHGLDVRRSILEELHSLSRVEFKDTVKECNMNRKQTTSAPDQAKGANKANVGKQPVLKFDKPLGSSHNDEADLRDVVRKAANKSK